MLCSAASFVISLHSLTTTNLSQPRNISINKYLEGKRLIQKSGTELTAEHSWEREFGEVEKAGFWYSLPPPSPSPPQKIALTKNSN